LPKKPERPQVDPPGAVSLRPQATHCESDIKFCGPGLGRLVIMSNLLLAFLNGG
jgi:hypothetical protein